MSQNLARAGLMAVTLAAVSLAAVTPPLAASPPTDVDVALVLAVDVSASMSSADLELQRQGYVAALRSPEVHKAISHGVTGRIGLIYFEWASRDVTWATMPWRLIDSSAAAHAFADELAAKPLQRGYRTSISTAIEHGLALLDGAPFLALRQVIDISGDGPNNSGRPVLEARDRAARRGVTINGLPITLKPPGPIEIADIDHYYRGCVITGPGSFVIPAKSPAEFANAVRTKIVFEIANLTPAEEPRVRFASQPERANCTIGEELFLQRSTRSP